MGDVIDVVEAAYRTVGSRQEWLAGVLDAVTPFIDRGHGTVAFFFDAHQLEALKVDASTAIMRGIAPEDARLFERMHQYDGTTARDVVRTYLSPNAFVSTSQAFGPARWAKLAHRYGRAPDRADSVALLVADPTREGITLSGFSRKVERIDPRSQRLWSHVAAHLAAGRRLLPSLTTRAIDADADAVLNPDGTIAHVAPRAKNAAVRTTLRDAALAAERARTKRVRADAMNALELWRGLVDGRWSMIDRFDTDGRRFMVAIKNDPAVAAPRILTARERQIAAYASMGHANKLIAYELGLTVGSVSAYLASALRKMGLRSRADLVAISVKNILAAIEKRR